MMIKVATMERHMHRSTCIALLALAAASCLEAPSRTGNRAAPWEPFRFRAVSAPRARSRNCVLVVPALTDADAEVRLLFDLQPDHRNYYYVSVRRSGLELGKVECGVELPIADWRPGGPADAAAPFAAERRVVVARRPGHIAVIVGHREVLRACDDTFTQGGVALGARGLPGPAPRVRVIRMGEVYAADDFMRRREDETPWQAVSGRWAVDSLKNPGLSANAFRYAGRPVADGPGIALLGEPWWDDYVAEVSVRPGGHGAVGLLFRYTDEQHYYLFRSRRDAAGEGTLELLRVAGGDEAVLASRSAVLKPGEWYRLGVAAGRDRLAATVDGNSIFDVRDDGLAFGRIGLYVAGGDGAEFDDVFVRGDPGLVETFSGGDVAWYRKGGTWSVLADETPRRLQGEGPATDAPIEFARLLGGEGTWSDLRLSATVASGSRGRLGLVARYRDELEYDEFRYDVDAKRYELILVRDGRPEVAADAPAGPLTAPRTLSLHRSEGLILCEADGSRVLSYFDKTPAPGKVGLSVGRASMGLFDSVAVDFPRQSEPVLTQLDVFARETTMANWAAAESDWDERTARVMGELRTVRWHRAAFPGGGKLRVAAFFDPARRGTLRLFTCCDLSDERGRAEVSSGYELAAASAGSRGDGALTLHRNGRQVARAATDRLRGSCRIVLQRLADYVVGKIDGAPVLVYKDPQPLGGWSAGYTADHVMVKPEDVDVFCDRTISYSFVRAASSWRTAGGEWLVTNRWRCDPRWSFFGGESKDGAAAIWNKARFDGDLTVEFAAGIRHQQRGGGYDRYASDMNVVICGDGRSLNSGYGFIFGGWDNSRTAVTRKGKVVKKSGKIIPTGGMHRRWFYYKIVRRGGRLRYYVDNELVLDYIDPDPLPGGQMALWTWQNGLMIARVRIAAEEIGPREPITHAYPDVSPCIYKP
jgi:hypothetical protein